MSELTAARLRELLHYDPETGSFKWIVGRSGVRNKRMGAAGGPDGQGYLRIKVDGQYYGAHRLAWLWLHDSWPGRQIDHLDGNRLNNKAANLREASCRMNSENRREAQTRSKTGLLGVSAPTKSCRKYVATIKADGKRILIGRFLSAQEAHVAYLCAKRKLHEGCTI